MAGFTCFNWFLLDPYTGLQVHKRVQIIWSNYLLKTFLSSLRFHFQITLEFAVNLLLFIQAYYYYTQLWIHLEDLNLLKVFCILEKFWYTFFVFFMFYSKHRFIFSFNVLNPFSCVVENFVTLKISLYISNPFLKQITYTVGNKEWIQRFFGL